MCGFLHVQLQALIWAYMQQAGVSSSANESHICCKLNLLYLKLISKMLHSFAFTQLIQFYLIVSYGFLPLPLVLHRGFLLISRNLTKLKII